MAIRDGILPEFDHEMANTRRVLERVPGPRFGWRPHPRSWTLRELAVHVATLPMWAAVTLERDGFDLAQPDPEPRPPVETPADLLALFDRHLARARAAIAAAGDAAFAEPWALRRGATVVFTMPRLATLRSFVLHHMIHHRAQLGVYLRLMDVPVPALYGPSADEGRAG